MTRYVPSHTDPGKPGRGRVIGQMALFLLDSFDTRFGSGEEHKNVFYVKLMPRDLRRAARDDVYKMENGLRLRGCEFPKDNPLDDSEPENLDY